MKVKPLQRKKDTPIEQAPKLMILSSAYRKLYSYSTAKNIEIMLFGVVDVKDNIYTIKDFVIPPQTDNSGAFVTTDDEKYAEWLHKMKREDRHKLRVHYHTHPNMQTTPSGTDQKTIMDKVENINDFYIRIIGNEKQEYHIDFYDVTNKLHYAETNMYMFLDDYTIQYGKDGPKVIPVKNPNAEKELDALISKKPTTLAYSDPTNPYSYNYSYAYPGYRTKSNPINDYIDEFLDILEKLEKANIKEIKEINKEELNAEKMEDVIKYYQIPEKDWEKMRYQNKINYIEDYINAIHLYGEEI